MDRDRALRSAYLQCNTGFLCLKEASMVGRSLLALMITVAAGCDEDGPTRVFEAPAPGARLEVSSLDARVGDRILAVVRLTQSPSVDPLAGIQGSVRFDPNSLRYVGQIADPPTLVMVSDPGATRGVVRILGVNARGLPARMVVLAFEVLRPGYVRAMRFESTLAVTRGLRTVALSISPGIRRGSEGLLPGGDRGRRLGVPEWSGLLAPGLDEPRRVPGQIVPGLRYGDVNLNGTINVLDVVAAANVAVGVADLLVNP